MFLSANLHEKTELALNASRGAGLPNTLEGDRIVGLAQRDGLIDHAERAYILIKITI